MGNVARDGTKRESIGATINADLAYKLRQEFNKSAVIEAALELYYGQKQERKEAPPKELLIYCPTCARKTPKQPICIKCSSPLPTWIWEKKEEPPKPPEEKAVLQWIK